jgi:hypothetical protein
VRARANDARAVRQAASDRSSVYRLATTNFTDADVGQVMGAPDEYLVSLGLLIRLSLIVIEKVHSDDDDAFGRVDGEIDSITGPQTLAEVRLLHLILYLHRRHEALNFVMCDSHRSGSGLHGLDDQACDREIGRLNATAAARFGHIPFVLSGAAPAIVVMFGDAIVWDTFIAVARLQSAPVVSCEAGANDKPRVKRSASLPAAL